MLQISRDDNKEYNPAIYFTLVKVFLHAKHLSFIAKWPALTARGVSMTIQGS